MTIVATLNTNDLNAAYYVQKNEQNNLKGLIWVAGGSALTSASLALTAGTAVLVGAAALGSLGTLVNDYARNSLGMVGVPALAALAGGAVAADYLAIKFTGYCFSNAIHHFGPEYQIARVQR